MKKKPGAAIVGGDSRLGYLANLLSDAGFAVTSAALENCPVLSEKIARSTVIDAVSAADMVILPLPASADGISLFAPFSFAPIFLSEIFAAAVKGQLILGGKLSKKLIDAVSFRKIELIDYFDREELGILNAIPTCEGALEIALRETTHCVFGSQCLVAGYGRIGKLLANNLRDMGAYVTVAARKYADFAWIEANRMRHIHIGGLQGEIGRFDIVFNTVPVMLFDEKILPYAKSGALFIDLASAPGGIDIEAACSLGLKALSALSLPGKVAPETAAKMIFNTVMNILEQI